jgi:hypothetical protein
VSALKTKQKSQKISKKRLRSGGTINQNRRTFLQFLKIMRVTLLIPQGGRQPKGSVPLTP